MRNIRLIIQYDGTGYSGWQIQSNGRTIQGELTRVLSLLEGRHVTVHGSGRTDAGAHAEGQIASFLMERDMEPVQLRNALNANLDRDIRVIDAAVADASFHARFSAKRKTYRYEIWTGPVVSPFLYRYVYHFSADLALKEMESAASILTGRHDFGAFTIGDNDSQDSVRTVLGLELIPRQDRLVVIIEADGFLRYMVRTIVGTLLEVGRGRLSVAGVKEALESRDRAKAGPTAPASGLTLVRVDY